MSYDTQLSYNHLIPRTGVKRICHITSVHQRYDTRISVKQCTSLALAGYDVILIVADGKRHEEKKGVKIIDVGTSFLGRAGRMTWTAMAIYKRALSVNADIYHFHDPELIPIGLFLKLQGRRVIYDVHEDYPKAILNKHYLFPLARKLIARILKYFEEFASKNFTGVVAASPAIAERFQELNIDAVTVQNFPILNELQLCEPITWKSRLDAVAYVGAITLERGAIEMVKAIKNVSKKKHVKNLSNTSVRQSNNII